jgi:glycosyltransferase involved in cell wall biosynthesis
LKRLLYIAYFFPPLGGAGVQRACKFVRYLPEFGWEATVITTRDSYWMEDPGLLSEIPPQTRVLRAGSFSPGQRGAASSGGVRDQGRIRRLRKWSRFFLVPDAYLGWTARAGSLARTELHQCRYDALLTTSSPDSVHLLGRRLKKEAALPWVADFRDPWTRRLSYDPPTPLHHAWHRRLEAACLREADAVVVTTGETRDDTLRLHPGLPPGKIEIIPNGYDEEDFSKAAALLQGAGPVGAQNAAPGAARAGVTPGPVEPILHAGQLNPERPIGPFLDGLRLFLERSPGQRESVRTLFLGGHYDRDLEDVRTRGLEQVVRFAPSRPHLDSVAALLEARILLLIEQDSDRGRLILPGKIFEYLRAGKPILGLVPASGAAARLIRSCGAGVVADSSDPESVARAIARLAGPAGPEKAAGEALRPVPRAEIEGFERRSLTRSLALLLDRVSTRT